MHMFLLALLMASWTTFAGFEKLTVENLDLDYVAPRGKGMVDRVGIGMGLSGVPFPIEINRAENTFELTSPFVDFTWYHPLKFIYDLEEVSTRKMYGALGIKRHFIVSESAVVKTKANRVYIAEKLNAFCEGGARGDFDKRLLEDCLRNMEVTIKRLEVPGDFFFNEIVKDLPLPPVNQLDIPADNFSLKVTEGGFNLELFVKYWFQAGVRVSGFVQSEDNDKILAMRIDQVRFGYFPVTNLFFQKLKEIIKSPEVTITQPWIRIKTQRLYENQ